MKMEQAYLFSETAGTRDVLLSIRSQMSFLTI